MLHYWLERLNLATGRIDRKGCSLVAAAAALAVAGCAQGGLNLGALPNGEPGLETGSTSIAQSVSTPVEPAPGTSNATTAAPKPAVAKAIDDARKLRLAGDKLKALAALDAAAEKEPKDKLLMKERGLVALDAGKVQKAETLLRKAFDPADADWRLHSGLGSALAAQGKQSEAQLQFAKALEIAPDHPSVLNNLALSYALDGKHDEAERLLKRITKSKGVEPKAQQNLALLLGLKGKIGEAKQVAESVLTPDKARVNVSYLEGLNAGGERAKVSRADPQPDQPALADVVKKN